MRVYWANALFTDADRDFNSKCAARLRANGIDVFLPQEASVNLEITPTAEAIFRVDSAAILASDAIVVCLDQESIDSGVACEIGLAYAYNIPMVGLYTDLRQDRSGPGRMYKNLYVIGAIESSGKVVRTIDELLAILQWHSRPIPGMEGSLISVPGAGEYDTFVAELESWYSPRWSSCDVVDEWIGRLNPRRLLEIGCGTGTLGKYVCNRHPEIFYAGYDISDDMLEIARSKCMNSHSLFTSNLAQVSAEPFDLVLAAFTLHDHISKEESIRMMGDHVSSRGSLGIIDLSTQDLPLLADTLRRGLACPAITEDSRLEPTRLAKIGRGIGLRIAHCETVLTRVTFQTQHELDRYLITFGIYEGRDLPLQLRQIDHIVTRERVANLLKSMKFPFSDERAFVACLFRKQ